MSNIFNDLNKIAFSNVLKIFSTNKCLPGNVFKMQWKVFLFFQIDDIFDEGFFDNVHRFLQVENSKTCCLLNFDKYKLNSDENNAAIFFNEIEKKKDYLDRLKKGGAADGWLYRVDSYGCTSEIGEWGIFCDKENDLAVLGFKDIDLMRKYQGLIDALSAKSIDDLLLEKTMFPFGNLTADWERELVANYS